MLKKDNLTVLIVGGIAREHALAWKIAQSPRVSKMYITPGNGGTGQIAENVQIDPMATRELITFAKQKEVDLTIITSDDPIAGGIVDDFQKEGLVIFGPTKAAAQVEWSKAFSKDLMKRAQVPTADYQTFDSFDEAIAFVKPKKFPLVVKASGLALGKGVVICQNLEEATQALDDIMVQNKFGSAGTKVVIEEFLTGQEVSVHALSDGKHSVIFPSSQDHKAIGEGDTGLNTGGMGVIAPVPWVNDKMMKNAQQLAVQPLLAELAKQGAPFVGCFYPGLMIEGDQIQVLEYNARFGDPEAEVYVRLLKTDLVDVIEACLAGKVDTLKLDWHDGFAACVVVASGGYPVSYDKNFPITGIQEAEETDGVVVFHAGTKMNDGTLVTSGGRVLAVTAIGNTLQQALDSAYAAIEKIHFDKMYYRRDIGAKALKK